MNKLQINDIHLLFESNKVLIFPFTTYMLNRKKYYYTIQLRIVHPILL